jgi:dihydroflavonol-4-reductase
MDDSGLVFVTGATGFLGRWLAPRLFQEGYHLRLLVRSQSDTSWMGAAGLLDEPKRVELVQGDITDQELIGQAMRGCRHVVHAAGYFRLWGASENFLRTNVTGTRVVAEAAIQAGVEKVVYVSSVAVVGVPPPGMEIDEDVPCAPADAYQESKLEAERVLRDLSAIAGLPVVILRPGAFYGPGSRYGFNRLFIEDPMRGLRIQVDHGRHLIFPVYVKDVAQAASLALAKDLSKSPAGLPPPVYNICDLPYSHAEINRMVSKILGISPWRLDVPRGMVIALANLMERWSRYSRKEPFYPINLRYYVFTDWLVSNERARRELGFKPTPMEKGLRETVEWYQSLL